MLTYGEHLDLSNQPSKLTLYTTDTDNALFE